MGKSNEKNYREARKERLNKEQKSSKKRTPRGVRRKKIKKGIIIAIIFVIIALIITGCSLNKAGVFDRKVVAFEIAGEEFTIADYNYWYKMISTQVISTMYAYPDRQTVMDNTFSIISVAKAAEAMGYKLEGDELDSYNATMTQIRKDCEAYKGTSRQFFNETYGFGTNEEIVLKNYKYQLLALSYYNDFIEKLDYSNEDLEKYYKEDGYKKLDFVDFKSCTFSADNGNTFKIPYASSADALAAANKLNSKITDEKSFDDAVNAEAQSLGLNLKDFKVADTLEEDLTYDKVNNEDLSAVRDWLFSKDRKANDHTVITVNIDGVDVYWVLFIVDPPSRETYKTIDMRHILISTTDAATGESNDTIKAAAKAKIEQICAEWEESDMTDKTFAELAKKYSADATAEEGGLIEKVAKKQLVEGIDEFLFSSDRKVGDFKIIESTYGYHLVYYKGTNVEKWTLNAKDYLIERDFETERIRLSKEHNIVLNQNDRLIDMFANEQQDTAMYY